MLILSFESSCDETSCAVVDMSDESRVIRSNIIASQISIHALYGGVVPEIASRAHCEAISSITDQALDKANITLDEIDAVAVTYTPGLVGALLVGVNFAKALELIVTEKRVTTIKVDKILCQNLLYFIPHLFFFVVTK